MVMDLYENRALKHGVLAFPFKTRNPVTSLTHKKMFDYFRTDAENFQFLQMVICLFNLGTFNESQLYVGSSRCVVFG